MPPGDEETMVLAKANRSANPLEHLTTAQLRAVAVALRDRAAAGRFPELDLRCEIARIERRIVSRESQRAQMCIDR
jgi:hypothetical protein